MRRLLALLLLSSTIYHLPSTILAADYQQCTASSTCTIGEFLYADDYTPLTLQSCSLTSKYPDGTAFLTSQAMVDRGDGWYSYDATIGATTGLYATTICCTPSSGTMCLDKTFEVKAPAGATLTAADIWSYSGRTLTSYGSLVSDIWGYSTRSLTSFGSVVSDVWGHSSRTMTSFGTLVADLLGTQDGSTTTTASPITLSAIVSEQNIQRELLEKLVNAPVVSLSLDDGTSIPDLESKLDENKKQAGILSDTISAAKSRLMTLDSKWNRLGSEAAEQEITAVATLIQDQTSLASLSKSWDTPSVATLTQESAELKTTLASLLSSTTIAKSTLAPSSLTTSLEHLSNMENVLGDATSSSGDPTFYGYLSEVAERNLTLSGENQKIAAIIENLNGQGLKNSQREVAAAKSRLLALNEYPGGESLATPAKLSGDDKLNLKNILFSLQALVGLNTQILAMNVGDPVRSLWLEEGSIIFRAVITNPSGVISQSVPLKFYLPREVKTEDIITLDPSLNTTYDSTEEALYASGTYQLAPKATKVVFVEIEDIWHLSADEIQTLRTQASDLLKPLEKTAYFSQGTTLKSDIDVTLDKVLLSTSKAVTPENRIRTYREAKLELAKVTSNMNRLQDLVAQSSGTGSVFGFVGGVQTVAVWGIILVVVAGFIFLSLYFKKLQPTPSSLEKTQPSTTLPHLSPLTTDSQLPTTPNWQMPALIAGVVLVTAVSTIFLTRMARPQTPPVINQVIVASPTPLASPSSAAQTPPLESGAGEPTPTPSPLRNDILINNPKDVLGEESEPASPTHTLTVPEDSTVNIRNQPSATADIIMPIKETVDVYVFKTSGDWNQIGFTESDLPKGYWVHSKFIEIK